MDTRSNADRLEDLKTRRDSLANGTFRPAVPPAIAAREVRALDREIAGIERQQGK